MTRIRIFKSDDLDLEVRVSPYPYEEGSFRVTRIQAVGSDRGMDSWVVSGENIDEQIDNILGHGFIEAEGEEWV